MTGSLSRHLVLLALAGAALAGCSSGPTRPDPTPLVPFESTLVVADAWKQKVGSIGFALSVPVKDGTFTVASDDGTVLALKSADGAQVWRTDVGAKISAGVGSDGRFAAVVTRDNELVTLDNGTVTWRKKLPSRVVSAPLVAGERVFVVAVDRTVHAFDAVDGRKLWTYQRPNDPLTLAQASVLQPYHDTLLVGQGGKLVGLDPLAGQVRWESTVASPRGTNEVERLADLVGPAARTGELVCARAFQVSVGCVNAERGTLMWSRNASGNDGLAGDERMVIGADNIDRLTAWRTVDGSVAWSGDSMLYRGLSGPAMAGLAVVFGDSEGYVHWFGRDSGTPVARTRTDGSAIHVTPVRAGNVTLVVTEDGGLFAFRSE
ncbi:MAG: outer membrane protein assembly factor BamB [Rhizobacter sp.]